MTDLKPENVPLHLVRIARDAFRTHHGTASDNSDLDEIRAMLAAVLPVAEQEVRESIGGSGPDEWAVARHWRSSTEYSRAMSEERARALLEEDRADGLTASLVRRTPAPWRPVKDVCGFVLAVGDDNETCVLPPHGDDVNHRHDPFAGLGDDAHSCDNCLGVDPDTCLHNGMKEGT